MGTIVTGIILFGALGFAFRSILKDKNVSSPRGNCGSCFGCPFSSQGNCKKKNNK